MSTTPDRAGRAIRSLPVGLFAVACAIATLLTIADSGRAGPQRAAAAPKNVTAPATYGAARAGGTLSSSHGYWSGTQPIAYAYQWLRCSTSGQSCSAIARATGSRYTVATDDVGSRLRVAVTASNKDGKTVLASAATAVVTGNAVIVAPANSVRPSISGTAREGQTLTAGTGSWKGTALTFSYQWERCDGAGANCADLPGATSRTYVLTTADAGRRLQVRVSARNSSGSTSAVSAPTDLVVPAVAGTGTAVQVTAVALPERLIIDRVSFSPNPLRSRSPVVARFRVSDTRGFLVSGALVYAIGVPYGWVRAAPEVVTGGDGWATLTFIPTKRLPLRRGGSLVFFVRARKPGENLLAGISTRRLVQMSLSSPGAVR